MRPKPGLARLSSLRPGRQDEIGGHDAHHVRRMAGATRCCASSARSMWRRLPRETRSRRRWNAPHSSLELIDPKVLQSLRRPAQHAVLDRQGRRLREQARRAVCRQARQGLGLRLVSASHRALCAIRSPRIDATSSWALRRAMTWFRSRTPITARPMRWCPSTGSGLDGRGYASRIARLKGKRIGVVAGTPPGNNMAANGLMANAKPYPLVVDTRVDSSAAAMMHDRRKRRDRRRHPVGADGRILRTAGEFGDDRRAAGQGDERPAPGLPHRHGRALRRSRLEAPAQSSDCRRTSPPSTSSC